MRLELHAPGWTQPPAHALKATRATFTIKLEEGSFEWDRWDIPVFSLSSQAALRLVQGMQLQKLFDNAHLQVGDDPHLIGNWIGPFLLVRGEWHPYDVPPKLMNVVLAYIGELPSSISVEQAAGAIVQAALAT